VVGALFRSTEFQNDRSELVFVVTPRLVKPLPPGYRLPTDGYTPPTRGDLMLNGRSEGQRSSDAPANQASSQDGFDTTATPAVATKESK
jgi:pilus assembly protein CpaC